MQWQAHCGEKAANEAGSEHSIHAELVPEPRRLTVPHTWDATSDSIAAWLATELHTSELVLLKSVSRPSGVMANAARAGLVDRCFPDAAARIPQVSWVNLRSDHCRVEPWIVHSEC